MLWGQVTTARRHMDSNTNGQLETERTIQRQQLNLLGGIAQSRGEWFKINSGQGRSVGEKRKT